MALEDRVKELEDELKVLKNEIQTTLLDIQEQILSHYYPSLYPSANKEANLASVNHAKETAAPPPPAVSPPGVPATVQPLGYHTKYKTQTITLVEEPDEDEADENDPVEEELPPVRLSVVPKSSHKKKKSGANGRSPAANSAHPAPKEPAQELSAEDNAFLDAIITNQMDTASKQTAVSFDEFKEVMQQKTADSPIEEDLFSEDLLDELLKDSLSSFGDQNLDGVTEILASALPETEEISNSNTINNQAVKLTVRKLLNWVDDSVTVIGTDPTKQAIEMYVRTGDLSTEMRQTLLRLVDTSFAKPATEKAGIRQVIDTLGQLNDILDHHTPEYLNQVMGFITEVNFG